jgi:hypothetical protein
MKITKKTVEIALQLGWKLDTTHSDKYCCLIKEDDESFINHWAAEWYSVEYDGKTVLVPHWIHNRIFENGNN